MGNSPIFDPISRLHLGRGDNALLIGNAMSMPGRTRRACAVFCVVHRGTAGTFTHVYLVPFDGGHRSEVFLAKVLDGERIADALDWSVRSLSIVAPDSGVRHAA